MKKRHISILVVGLLFIIIYVVSVFAGPTLQPVKPASTLKPPPSIQKPITTKKPTTKGPQRPPQPQVTKGKVPDIPKVWGDLVSSQFLMDGSYLTFTFSDKNGVIRVATFKKKNDTEEIQLFNLLIFNRTDKNDLKLVVESKPVVVPKPVVEPQPVVVPEPEKKEEK